LPEDYIYNRKFLFFLEKQPRRLPRTRKKRGGEIQNRGIAATDFLLKHRFLGETARKWASVARKMCFTEQKALKFAHKYHF
jgi:hypothetical protein